MDVAWSVSARFGADAGAGVDSGTAAASGAGAGAGADSGAGAGAGADSGAGAGATIDDAGGSVDDASGSDDVVVVASQLLGTAAAHASADGKAKQASRALASGVFRLSNMSWVMHMPSRSLFPGSRDPGPHLQLTSPRHSI